jgi:hypothetical protein
MGESWPQVGRERRGGEPPTELQRAAVEYVRSMEVGPVGDGSTHAEIEQAVPGITLDELNDCLKAGWLRLSWWGVIGGEPSGEADCWSGGDKLPPTPAQAEREAYRRNHAHEWHEAETKERFDPPWEACECGVWRPGPHAPVAGIEVTP